MAVGKGSGKLLQIGSLSQGKARGEPREAAMTFLTILALTLLLVWCELAGAPLR
jgi:hypothetical protein